MSSWVDVNASLTTLVNPAEAERVLLADLPEGSEGPLMVSELREFRGVWIAHGSLRDRDEEDVPTIRDWFVSVVTELRATEAGIQIDGTDWTYVYEMDGDDAVKLRPRMWSE